MMRRSFKVFADNYCCGIHNMSVVFHIKAVRAGTMIIRPAATASRDNLRIREDQSFSLWPRERPQEKPLTTIIYYQQPLVPDGTTRPLCHLLPRMEGKLTVFVTTTCLLAATIAIANGASLPGFEECVLNNHHYGIGDTFHPVIDVNGTKFEAVCFNCTCLPSAIAQCDQVICPPADCPNPIRFAGQCCDICIPPPTLTPDDSCLYHGIQISGGEVFRPTDLIEDYQAVNNTARDECIECRCDNNEVTCYDASDNCPALACNETDATYQPGKCCLQCPETPVIPVFGAGCYDFNGRYILEGEWWHPTLPEYGLVECVNCTCQNAVPRCERLPCPEVPPCGPDDPIEDVIVCCPRCRPNTPTLSSTEPPIVLNNETSINTTTTPITPDITPDITPCENPYIYKIYTHITHDTLALHNLETSIVEIYNWTSMVSPGGPLVEREYFELNAVAFVEQSNGEFIFEGWTIDRRVRGLMNKPSKRERIEACTEECARMVAQMLRPVETLSETLVCGRR